MKNSNFIIRIPEPCHEDWNKMLPEEKGRYCNSCQKTVIDFTNKTDDEIKTILEEQKNQKVCGHFKKSQVNRPLNYTFDLHSLPKNMTTTKAFAIALFLVFGSILFSCTNEKNQKIDVMGQLIEFPEPTTTTGMPMRVTEENPIEPIEKDLDEIQIITYQEPLLDVDTHYGRVVTGNVNSSDSVAEEDSVQEYINMAIKTYGNLAMMGAVSVEIIEADSTVTDSSGYNKNGNRIGDNEIINTTNLSVFPNPSNGDFTIKYDITKRTDITIDIYNAAGVLVKNVVNQPSQYEGKYLIPVNLSDLPDGVYFINLINNGQMFTEKLVLTR